MRLVSKYTVEEKIIEVATKKLLLEFYYFFIYFIQREIILNPIKKMQKEDLESLLKNGCFELFK